MENSIADSNIYLDRSCRLSGRDKLHVVKLHAVELHKDSWIEQFTKKIIKKGGNVAVPSFFCAI